ncbi:hypothetical protein [Herbaspirillum sp. SJZ107]|uniref:hypothetical protein n=1 Tax=Herbaspirillum sp. SJZ107 TaxID=2572881 RepID=UPI00115434F9|nr:hypothetical protein [Herbaspirillum sp. SJZ107]TQK00163.1 hypothetical protein FBX97_5828 [Herbaspirillum sp. SJZ107]
MKNHSLHIAGTPGLRVDGIDVAQLLRDLGEASAASSAVDLFGLCLSAQRVLERVHATTSSPAAGTSWAEAELLGSYRAMSDDGRSRLVSMARRIQKPFARQRPGLMLIEGSRDTPNCGFLEDKLFPRRQNTHAVVDDDGDSGLTSRP